LEKEEQAPEQMREQSLLFMHLCVHKPRREPSDGREEAKLNERKIAKSLFESAHFTWTCSRLFGNCAASFLRKADYTDKWIPFANQ
jgi:hypothetical protein